MSRTVKATLNKQGRQWVESEVIRLTAKKGELIRDYEAKTAEFIRLKRERKDEAAWAVWQSLRDLLLDEITPLFHEINFGVNALETGALWR